MVTDVYFLIGRQALLVFVIYPSPILREKRRRACVDSYDSYSSGDYNVFLKTLEVLMGKGGDRRERGEGGERKI